MSAIVELSTNPCHFCGKTGQNFKAKVKSQELQAVVCDTHLREVLAREAGHSLDSAKPAMAPKALPSS